MGTRPVEFPRALESLLAQQGVDLDVVVVGQRLGAGGAAGRACAPSTCPRTSASPRAATSGRRSRAATFSSSTTTTPTCPPTTCWRGWSTCCGADQRVGAVAAAAGRPDRASRRRSGGCRGPGGRDPLRPGVVGWVWEGTFVVRRRAVRAGRRLARALLLRPRGHRAGLADLGRGVRHLVRARRRDEPPGDLARPGTTPTTGSTPATGSGSRGGTCPWPLAVVYVAVWTALTVVRFRSPRLLRLWFAGFREGLGPGRRRAAADALADRVAAHPGRATAGRLSNTRRPRLGRCRRPHDVRGREREGVECPDGPSRARPQRRTCRWWSSGTTTAPTCRRRSGRSSTRACATSRSSSSTTAPPTARPRSPRRSPREDPRVTVVRLPENSGGCSRPRNAGIDRARAPYVMFLDSDDVYERHACKNLLLSRRAHRRRRRGRAGRAGQPDAGPARRPGPRSCSPAGRSTAASGRTRCCSSTRSRPTRSSGASSWTGTASGSRRACTTRTRCSRPRSTARPRRSRSSRTSSTTGGSWRTPRRRRSPSAATSSRTSGTAIAVHRMMDDFLREHGSADLKVHKDFKFIRHDLKLYLSDLPHRDEEYQQRFMRAGRRLPRHGQRRDAGHGLPGRTGLRARDPAARRRRDAEHGRLPPARLQDLDRPGRAGRAGVLVGRSTWTPPRTAPPWTSPRWASTGCRSTGSSLHNLVTVGRGSTAPCCTSRAGW